LPDGELVNLRDNKRTYQAELADFIVPNLDGNGEIDISGWESAHHAITSIWERQSPLSSKDCSPNVSQTKRSDVV
jgi:hypothetical protein